MFYSDLIMTDLNTKAENYAAEKTNDLIAKAIAQAYADGYRDGYKDCEAERPVILNDSSNEYVDLGLPSGTLWASDYERANRSFYLSYESAVQFSLPTRVQVQELFDCCIWKMIKDNHPRRFACIGPNGKSIVFHETGYRIPEPVDRTEESHWQVWFWIKEQTEQGGGIKKYAAHVKGSEKGFEQFTPGLLLPLRLVKTK